MPKLTPTQARKLDEEDLHEANATRAPTNQVLEARCPGTVRKGPRKGEGCTRAPGSGTDHPGIGYCSKHGGNTPAGSKSAARSYGRQLILEHKERFGGDRDDPLINNITAESALVEELKRSVAMVRWLESRIGAWQLAENETEEEDLSEGSTKNLPPLVNETSKGAPGATDVQVWLLLYREERKHAAQIAKMCIDANISKRMVNLAESQGLVLSRIVKETLKALELTQVQASLVPTILPVVIARVNREYTMRMKPDDALREAEALPAIPTAYKSVPLPASQMVVQPDD